MFRIKHQILRYWPVCVEGYCEESCTLADHKDRSCVCVQSTMHECVKITTQSVHVYMFLILAILVKMTGIILFVQVKGRTRSEGRGRAQSVSSRSSSLVSSRSATPSSSRPAPAAAAPPPLIIISSDDSSDSETAKNKGPVFEPDKVKRETTLINGVPTTTGDTAGPSCSTAAPRRPRVSVCVIPNMHMSPCVTC